MQGFRDGINVREEELGPGVSSRDEVGSVSSSMLVETGDNYQDSLVSADEREMEASIEDDLADDIGKIDEEDHSGYQDEFDSFNSEHHDSTQSATLDKSKKFSFDASPKPEGEVQSSAQQWGLNHELDRMQPDAELRGPAADELESKVQANGIDTSGGSIEYILDDGIDTPRNIDVDTELKNELSEIEKMLEDSEAYATPSTTATDDLQEDLPHGWTSAVDPLSGNIYFVDTINQKSQWERPVVHRETNQGDSFGLNSQNGTKPYTATNMLLETSEISAQEVNGPSGAENLSVSDGKDATSVNEQAENEKGMVTKNEKQVVKGMIRDLFL